MQIKTYRAGSIPEALELVHGDLGPDAAVLQLREQPTGWLRRLFLGRRFEVTASTGVNVPSRLPQSSAVVEANCETRPAGATMAATDNDELVRRIDGLHSIVETLCRESRFGGQASEAALLVFKELIDNHIEESEARRLLEEAIAEASELDRNDPGWLRRRIRDAVEALLPAGGPIRLSKGSARIVALVGPTGVGKTTTIAKLAANFRLRGKKSVGLITVDTYRIAAVEQLRTYAQIIDLPMEVVASPQEMRRAVHKLSNHDVVLIDTAGRSPRDDQRIGELKAILTEANPDETHLVLSSVASSSSLLDAADRFETLGVTSLLLSKLDEAAGLANVLPLARERRLPLSYVTNGQNVPDDIAAADPRGLARRILPAVEGGF